MAYSILLKKSKTEADESVFEKVLSRYFILSETFQIITHVESWTMEGCTIQLSVISFQLVQINRASL